MKIDDALEIIAPDRDSQFKLLPCKNCESNNVAYVRYQHLDGERWRIQCFDCGETLALEEDAPRHHMQLLWNRRKYARSNG